LRLHARRDRFLIGVVAVALMMEAGCGAASPQRSPVTTVRAEQARFNHARALFRMACGGCHRLEDAGTHGTRKDLARSGLARVVETPRERYELARYAILYGEADTSQAGVGMPAWKGVLRPRDVNALARYLAAVIEPVKP
jgi:mono/diheme cytochrome c family protein